MFVIEVFTITFFIVRLSDTLESIDGLLGALKLKLDFFSSRFDFSHPHRDPEGAQPSELGMARVC